jgi:hypothetical protein
MRIVHPIEVAISDLQPLIRHECEGLRDDRDDYFSRSFDIAKGANDLGELSETCDQIGRRGWLRGSWHS